MSLVVVTGGVRSGKSAAAERLAAGRGTPVVACVAGWDGDEEMRRRIEAHRSTRPASWETRRVGADAAWIAEVPADTVLLLDCLGSLISTIAWEVVGERDQARSFDEANAKSRSDALVNALQRRGGDTVVVTNEVGWGLVPASASGRLFRDLMGRANRALIDRADAAYLTLDGRFIDLKSLPTEPAWPAS